MLIPKAGRQQEAQLPPSTWSEGEELVFSSVPRLSCDGGVGRLNVFATWDIFSLP